jgi:metallophosphoesterase superfamily enzyme
MAAHAEQLERELAAAKAEVERLREALTEIIKYAKGVHDPHLEELTRDFLKEMK